VTAYAQPVADPTAVVGRRIGAYAIDTLLILVLALVVLIPSFDDYADQQEFTTSGQAQQYCEDVNDTTTNAFCINLNTTVYELAGDDANAFTQRAWVTPALVGLLNLVVLQGLTGASVGKLILGLRVVRENGQKAGIGWAALRYLLLAVDSICCFLPGAVLVFTTKGHRRLGDMAASTFVVRAGQVGTPPQIPGMNSPWPGQQPGYQTGAMPGWGTQAGPAPAQPQAQPSGDGPTWDQARNAYIQYDRERGEWMQWNDQAQAWRPIDQ
jgi:uncharacterized RDD family membrane protein YckC